jgi:plastocyanin
MSYKTALSRRWTLPAGALTLTLALTACSSVASPTPSSSSMPPMSMASTVSTTPSTSTAPSPSGPVRCAVTPNAAPSATVKIFTDNVGFFNFSDPVTVKAGQAVVFKNPNGSPHTITEGTNGQAVAGACVDAPIASNANVTVTFYQPGTYQITCIPHPSMQTSVIVKPAP